MVIACWRLLTGVLAGYFYASRTVRVLIYILKCAIMKVRPYREREAITLLQDINTWFVGIVFGLLSVAIWVSMRAIGTKLGKVREIHSMGKVVPIETQRQLVLAKLGVALSVCALSISTMFLVVIFNTVFHIETGSWGAYGIVAVFGLVTVLGVYIMDLFRREENLAIQLEGAVNKPTEP